MTPEQLHQEKLDLQRQYEIDPMMSLAERLARELVLEEIYEEEEDPCTGR